MTIQNSCYVTIQNLCFILSFSGLSISFRWLNLLAYNCLLFVIGTCPHPGNKKDIQNLWIYDVTWQGADRMQMGLGVLMVNLQKRLSCIPSWALCNQRVGYFNVEKEGRRGSAGVMYFGKGYINSLTLGFCILAPPSWKPFPPHHTASAGKKTERYWCSDIHQGSLGAVELSKACAGRSSFPGKRRGPRTCKRPVGLPRASRGPRYYMYLCRRCVGGLLRDLCCRRIVRSWCVGG